MSKDIFEVLRVVVRESLEISGHKGVLMGLILLFENMLDDISSFREVGVFGEMVVEVLELGSERGKVPDFTGVDSIERHRKY